MIDYRKIILLIAFLVVDIILTYVFIEVYSEYLWFRSVGYDNAYISMIIYRILLFVIAFSISFSILTINGFITKKTIEDFIGYNIRYYYHVDVIISLIIAYAVSGDWIKFVYFLNSTEFNLVDPIFKNDVSFYVFKIPFIRIILAVIATTIVFCFIISFVYYAYYFRWVRSYEEFREIFPDLGYVHISSLFAAVFIILAVHLYISRFELIFSQHGVVSGASWVEVNVTMPSMLFLSFASMGFAVASIYFGRRRLEYLAVLFLIFLVICAFAIGVVPFFFQKFKVEPNELEMEWNYINYSIHYTRFAFGLENVKRIPYEIDENITSEKIERHRGTIDNIRLWDHRPLLDVYRQIQQIRTYYVISDVDVDRYYVNGKYTQIMISARELSTELLPRRAKTWVNEHLIYTHGYGVVASPVNAISEEGLPELIIRDIPPSGMIRIERPEIYYGELTNDYVIVNTKQDEFDYPLGDKNVFTKYKGIGGVRLDSFWKRLLFSMKFGDVNIILSQYLTEESRILMHRNIVERVKIIAPYLEYDRDPYIAVINGRLYWIIDAYTILEDFPYSYKYNGICYIRNPVKIFVDAYNGTVEFYVIQDEPVVKTLEKAFPIFKYELDEGKRRHIRYPINLFDIQAHVYSIYHMDDVETFYNREDVWQIPNEMFERLKIEMEPYYVILSLESKPEFILMLPFTPKDRENLVAWMCARCDEKYGELILYEFPKGRLIYGPMQIEARIDQNPEISKLFTLWGQVGSRIIRGNLLVIPIEGSILYVEPIYLRAERSHIPELRGVIVAHEESLVMDSNLYTAIEKLIGVKPAVIPERKEEKKMKGIGEIVKEAMKAYERALESIRKGNWSGFGYYLERIGELLEELNKSVVK